MASHVRAISKHCCARRRYSSALLAAIRLPVRPVDDERSQRFWVPSGSSRQPQAPATDLSIRCPLYPQKRTSTAAMRVSALCH